jgi:hypothetical protein
MRDAHLRTEDFKNQIDVLEIELTRTWPKRVKSAELQSKLTTYNLE